MRPPSIGQFERLYGFAIAISLLFSLAVLVLGATTSLMQAAVLFGIIFTVIQTGLEIVLLLFVSRRGNVIAKWIYELLVVVLIIWWALSFYSRGAGNSDFSNPLTLAVLAVGLLTIACRAYAAVLLFRGDALDWFEGGAVRADGDFADPTYAVTLILGILIAAFLFLFFSHVGGGFGQDCYYVEALTSDTACINPAWYRGGWLLSLLLLGGGLFGLWKDKQTSMTKAEE